MARRGILSGVDALERTGVMPSESDRRKRLAAAGLVGAGVLAAPQDAEATFLRAATPTVRNAPKSSYKATEENMNRALEMFDEGIDPREIYDETGFFKGADGVLRFEISDQGVLYRPERDRDLVEQDGDLVSRGRLFSLAVDHPSFESELGEGPPSNRIVEDEAGNRYDPMVYEFEPDDDDSYAGFVRGRDIYLNKKYVRPEERQRMIDESPFKEATQRDLDKLSPEAILMHEQQHVIQDEMGLARGGNTRASKRKILDQIKLDNELAGVDEEFSIARNRIGDLSRLETVLKYRNYAREGWSPNSNLTGKRRLLVNNGAWYQYSDKIRRELGPEPKRHRPKREREQWLSDAWMELSNHLENEMSADAKLKALKELNMFPELQKRNPEFRLTDGARAYDELVADGTIQQKDLKNAINRQSRKLDKLRPKAQRAWQIKNKRDQLESMSDREVYKNLAGEVEARNTEARLNMSMDERYRSYPKDTEDVPREQQILIDRPMTDAEKGSVTPGALAGAGLLGAAGLAVNDDAIPDWLEVYSGGGDTPIPPSALENKLEAAGAAGAGITSGILSDLSRLGGYINPFVDPETVERDALALENTIIGALTDGELSQEAQRYLEPLQQADEALTGALSSLDQATRIGFEKDLNDWLKKQFPSIYGALNVVNQNVNPLAY